MITDLQLLVVKSMLLRNDDPLEILDYINRCEEWNCSHETKKA